MKLHIGVDSQSGLAHSAVVTAANVHDKHPLPSLLHGRERRVYGDSAYASQKVLIHAKARTRKDFTNQRTRKAGSEVDEVKRAKNHNKSKIRARVEHVFAVVKRLWGFNKVRYRGLDEQRHACVRGTGAGQHLSGDGDHCCNNCVHRQDKAGQGSAAQHQSEQPTRNAPANGVSRHRNSAIRAFALTSLLDGSRIKT